MASRGGICTEVWANVVSVNVEKAAPQYTTVWFELDTEAAEEKRVRTFADGEIGVVHPTRQSHHKEVSYDSESD
jgi:hypothetical protein